MSLHSKASIRLGVRSTAANPETVAISDAGPVVRPDFGPACGRSPTRGRVISDMTLHGLPVMPQKGITMSSPASQCWLCSSLHGDAAANYKQRQRAPPAIMRNPCLKPQKDAAALVQLRAAAGRHAGGSNGSGSDSDRGSSGKPVQTSRCFLSH